MNLGERLYKLRQSRNMSQGDLADALGVSRQSISKWENNATVPELSKLVQICDLFEVSMDELVRGIKSENKETKEGNFWEESLSEVVL